MQPARQTKLVRGMNGDSSPAATAAAPPARHSARLMQPKLSKRQLKLSKPLKLKKGGKQQYGRAAAPLAAAMLSPVQPPPPPPRGAAVNGRLSTAARESMAAADAGRQHNRQQQGSALRVVQSPMSPPPPPPPRLQPVFGLEPVGLRGAQVIRMQANRLQPVQLTSGHAHAGATAFSRRTAAAAGSAQGMQQQQPQQGHGGLTGRLQPQGQVGRGDTAVGQQVRRGAGPAGGAANKYDMNRDNSMQSPRQGAFVQGMQAEQQSSVTAAQRSASPAGRITNRYNMIGDSRCAVPGNLPLCKACRHSSSRGQQHSKAA